MPKPPITGYIVVRKHDFNVGALELCFGHDLPKAGILLWGDCATVFKSRGACWSAISRTTFFLSKEGEIGLRLDVSRSEYKIQALRARR